VTELLIFGLFGLVYGIVLQRSGFCFARAGFELFLLRSREACRGVLAALAAGTIGFAAVAAWRAHSGLDPQTHLLIIPFGLGTVVGGVLFGLGMALAGMCAAGTLLRIGEGYAVAWLSLLGLALGAALDPFRFLPEGWKTQAAGVWLGGRIGLPAATAMMLLLLAALWIATARRTQSPGLTRGWLIPPVVGGLILGLVNAVQSAYSAPWTVAYPLSLVAEATSGRLTHGAVAAALPLLVLDAGLVAGALASAASGARYRLKWPRSRQQVVTTLVGGVLMGWGVQLARGCSIGGAFSAFASLSLSAWLFLPALLGGAWVGTQVVRRGL